MKASGVLIADRDKASTAGTCFLVPGQGSRRGGCSTHFTVRRCGSDDNQPCGAHEHCVNVMWYWKHARNWNVLAEESHVHGVRGAKVDAKSKSKSCRTRRRLEAVSSCSSLARRCAVVFWRGPLPNSAFKAHPSLRLHSSGN